MKLRGCSILLCYPGRLTWNLQITKLRRKMIFQTSMRTCCMLIFMGVIQAKCHPDTSYQPSPNSCRVTDLPLHDRHQQPCQDTLSGGGEFLEVNFSGGSMSGNMGYDPQESLDNTINTIGILYTVRGYTQLSLDNGFFKPSFQKLVKSMTTTTLFDTFV